MKLIHAVLWQNPTQHCKAIILQLKINLKKENQLILPITVIECMGEISKDALKILKKIQHMLAVCIFDMT